MTRLFSVSLSIVVILTVAFGCSSGKSSPVTPVDISTDIPTGEMEEENHQLLGVWELEFDAESLKAIVTPSRLANTHYQVKYLIPPPEVVINTIYPNYVVDADVTLTNPFVFDAYDVRLILFTDDEHHILENPDCWTGLYDIPAGLPINPFKAYAKDEPNRVFAGGTNHTENLLVFSPPGSHPIQFAVDASYPSNCEEPYEITDFTQGVLYDEIGYSTDIEITVRDWQEDVSEVKLYCPEITGGALLTFDQIDPEKWKAELVNETGASADEYVGYVIATSSNSGSLALYNEIAITISTGANIPSNPQIVATIRTMSKCLKIALNGDYAFCACGDEGVKIFDISQPCSPSIVSSIETEMARDVAVNNGFLYIADAAGGFKIVDVRDISSPVSAASLPSLFTTCIAVFGNYAYVMGSLDFNVVDVSDPYNPEIIPNSVDISSATDMTIDGDYLYLTQGTIGSALTILDISEPANPEIVKEIHFGYPRAVDVADGYAYIAFQNTLTVVDVADPQNAQEVGSLNLNAIRDVAASGDYVFAVCEISSSPSSLKVVDVSDPTTPVEVGEVEMDSPYSIVAKGNYAFVADDMESLEVVDINNPNEPFICGFYRLSTVQDVIIENDYAYIVARYDGIYIVDIAEPSSPIVLGHIDALYDLTGADVEGDFLYYADQGVLLIADISNPAVPENIGFLAIDDTLAWSLKVIGDYAYITNELWGFSIVDVSTPADPVLVSNNWSISSTRDLVIEGNYAYVSRSESGWTAFQVLDISDPTDPFSIGEWETSKARGIAKQNQYVYIGYYDLHVLNILDVTDPTLPVLAGSVITEHLAGDVAVQGNYAYIAGFEPAGGGGLEIVDITDPTAPVLFSSLITDGHASGIAVEGRYAYLADLDGGLKIIKLW